MDIDAFLDEYVEGYLFKDLDSMAAIPSKAYGGVAWPMVISVLSGMELLGALLFDKPFNPESGDTYFRHYWVQFLGSSHPEYKKVKGGDGLMRALVRHGLAHAFLTAPGIMVTKDRRNHLRFYPAPHNTLSIDSLQLAADFQQSYERRVCPIVCGTPMTLGPRTINRQSMQERLVEVTRYYTDEANKHIGALPSTRLASSRIIKTYPSSSVPSLNMAISEDLQSHVQRAHIAPPGPGTQVVFPEAWKKPTGSPE